MAVPQHAPSEEPAEGDRPEGGGDPASGRVLPYPGPDVPAAPDYRTLIEWLPAITYTAVDDPGSPSGYRSTFVSPQVADVLGYTAEEFLADPELWNRITHPDDLEWSLEVERRTSETHDPYRIEYRLYAKDGSLRWIRDEAAVAVDETTGQAYWLGFMVDVTAEKEAQQKNSDTELLYRSLIETLPAVVFVDELDESASNIYTSPQTTGMLGYTPDDWREDRDVWMKMIHPEDRDRVATAQRAHVERGGVFDQQYRVITKDGGVVWIRDIATVIRGTDGRARYSQGLFLDISAQKEAERELQDSLDREHEANAKLREIDELKNTLLHAVSHDLQNPLAAIVGAVATLTNSELDLPEELQRELLEGMATRARKVSRLLRDLLDLDRLDQGIIEPNRVHVDVAKLVSDAARCCDALDGHRVETGDEQAIGFVDPAKVERILENLLVNAARYTPAGGHVWARAEPADGGVLVVVEDDGPGVPDDAKAAIFERFRRGPEADRAPGTGVGLSLVSRFAELHGGRAWVEDRPGGGASFGVFLPDLQHGAT